MRYCTDVACAPARALNCVCASKSKHRHYGSAARASRLRPRCGGLDERAERRIHGALRQALDVKSEDRKIVPRKFDPGGVAAGEAVRGAGYVL
jgi:hypothetical protein